MTIGIGIAGPRAGLAVWHALRAVEAVGRGMIGGFVSMAALSANGEVLRAETQRCGSAGLFPGGSPPPARIAEARGAVLMSSGPDRTEPLSQFTPARADVALITGHRLPNMPGGEGRPLNTVLLERIGAGEPAEAALAALLEENPQADAGLIAVTPDGGIVLGNSALVGQRTDAGSLRTQGAGLHIAVLHNAIFPVVGLAAIAAGAAMDAAAPGDAHDLSLQLEAGLALKLADTASLEADHRDIVRAITVTHPGWLSPHWQGAVALRDTVVHRNGWVLGRLVTECYCVAREGILVSCDGQQRAKLLALSAPSPLRQ